MLSKSKTYALLVCLLTGLVAPLGAQTLHGKLAADTANHYRQLARYPESSQVLMPDAADPVRVRHEVNKVSARLPEGQDGPVFNVWPAKVSFVHPEAVVLHASFERGTSTVAASSVIAEVVVESGDVIGTLTLHDDGVETDQSAADGVYSGRFEVPAGALPEVAASYMVRFSALEGEETRTATGGFLYSRPAAQLTGRYRDRVIDGNLVIRAMVDVTAAGRYHLAGTLYTMSGEPVGTAQAAVELEPGRRFIDLSFYGLMFHDRHVSGPFRLGTVALTNASSMPNALADVVENAHVTRPYGMQRFTARAFDQGDLLQAAERLEAEAARAAAER